MSLTLKEKIELVAARYDPEVICDALEIDSLTLLEAYAELLLINWYKFEDIEDDLEDGYHE
ncbi:MAG: hypothetical protein JKY96_04540 [Phycisphaerales bacterium]|nr:hypothetical protein [Phycisphaerales bacterium]